MHVLHVISSIDWRAGGPTSALLTLAGAQRVAGLDVTVIATWTEQHRPDAAGAIEAAGAKVKLIGPCRGRLMRHPDLEAVVEQAVREADVVHIHALWEEIQHRAAAAARRLNKPYVFGPCGMLDPWSLAQNPILKRIYLGWRLREDLNKADLLHFTSDAARDLVRALNLSARAVVVPNGIALEEFERLPAKGTFRARFPAIGDRRMLLFMSRIHPKKGLDLLIDAFAQSKLNDVVLVVAGPDSGEYVPTLKALARQKGVEDRVVFVGMLNGEQRVEALADADLFVLPSRQENFGVAVTEALAAGTPVLVSDQVNICQEIQLAGVGGVVPLEAGAIAEGLRRWMEDGELRHAAQARARQFIRERYDRNEIAARWSSLYVDLVERRKRPAGVFDVSEARVPRVRVVHFIPALDARTGGVAAAVVGLAPAQARAGLDVTVVSGWAAGERTDMLDELTHAGVKLQLIGPVRGRMRRHRDLRRRTRAAVANADIVHIHSLWEELQHQAARAARLIGRPYLFSPHGMLDPWSLAQNALVKQLYLKLRLRRDLNGAAALHFTAELEKQLVAPLGLTPRGVVIANGLRLDEFEQLPPRGTFRTKYPQLGERPIVLFMSRVHYKKGLDLLIPAFAKAQLPAETMLVIAGPSAEGYLPEVEMMVHDNGLADRTVLTGMLRGRERVEALADADLFVLPSRQENFGIVIVEALAANCPVVISDQVNIHREISAAGVGGVVPLDVQKLAEELARWMTDESLRSAAKARARDFVWRNYDWNAIARQWVRVYLDLAYAPQSDAEPVAGGISAGASLPPATMSARVEQDTA